MTLQSLGGWDYRVMRYKEGALGVHEVYYDKATGVPHSCTENPVGAVGDDLDDLRAVLQRMLVSLDVEILDYETIAATTPTFSDDEDPGACGECGAPCELVRPGKSQLTCECGTPRQGDGENGGTHR